MNKLNEEYLRDCYELKDLMIFGIYDPKQNYAIFHKWGKEKDVMPIVEIMKKTAKNYAALKDDVLVTFKYPEFSLEDLDKFINNTTYFFDWIEKKNAKV
jgi:hypothetical protein